jgi:5-(carboxyamino)imidazole ribonucleotide mutase
MSGPLVGIIMGSDSDLPVMNEAKETLDSFGVANEITIVSAHRTTKRMVRYATTAKKRGLEIIIAGAGGAAHLPGMVAAVAINGAKNAGILACQILGTKYPNIAMSVEKYKRELESNVLKKARKLEKSGVGRYMGRA